MSIALCPNVAEEFSQSWHESHEVAGEPEKFVKLIKKAVKNYLEAFFFNRDMYCGGPINTKLLFSKKVMSTVMDTDSESGMRRAYLAMARDNFKQKKKNKETEDIWFVITLLKQCARLGIPKCFRPGFILVYLELCEGIQVL